MNSEKNFGVAILIEDLIIELNYESLDFELMSMEEALNQNLLSDTRRALKKLR